ncbi:MAG: radical SAM protein [Oscillospiraceae bacterium]|nr:radical SAM protein [Oscillospiraceae bacterium]
MCELCPRKCNTPRVGEQVGFCGMGTKVKIACAALHFWEEPCISGERGSGTVFFSGCNLKCVFCQNYEISTCHKGYYVSNEELAELFLSLETQGAHNLNLVTPTHFVPQIIEALKLAKTKGFAIPVVYNCGGYERVETIRMLEGFVDVYIPDFKYHSEKLAEEYSSAPGYFEIASNAIAEMVAQVGSPVFGEDGIMRRGVLVRHLMLPGCLFDTKKVIDHLYDTYGDRIYLSLMSQYTPMPQCMDIPKLSKQLSPKHYDAMVDYCVGKGITQAFVQAADSASSAFIPEFAGE